MKRIMTILAAVLMLAACTTTKYVTLPKGKAQLYYDRHSYMDAAYRDGVPYYLGVDYTTGKHVFMEPVPIYRQFYLKPTRKIIDVQ